MKYKISIPPASAKRLENKRYLIISSIHIGDISEKAYLIPENENCFKFEHVNKSLGNEYDDGTVYYHFYIEYRNATDTRVERKEFKLSDCRVL